MLRSKASKLAIMATLCLLLSEHSTLAGSDVPAVQLVTGDKLGDAVHQRMVDCVKQFPPPADAVQSAQFAQNQPYVAACGKDYVAYLQQIGMTPNEASSFATSEVGQIFGCRFANVDMDDSRNVPVDQRILTCSQDHIVPTKAKSWLVTYVSGRVTFVAGPYESIIQCAHSDEAAASRQEYTSCMTYAVSPIIGEGVRNGAILIPLSLIGPASRGMK